MENQTEKVFSGSKQEPQGRKQDSSQSKTRAQDFDLLIGELHCLEQK